MSASCQFDKLERLIEGLLADAGEPLDVSGGLPPQPLPLRALLVEELGGDVAFELVLVGGLDEPAVLLHPTVGGVHPLADVDLDLAVLEAQGVGDTLGDVGGHVERPEVLEVLGADVLLSDEGVGLAALRAAVVDVLLLLLLRGDGGTAVAAGEQAAAIGELQHLGARVGMALHPVLHALVQRPVDDARVLAVVDLAAPLEAAGVQRLAEDGLDLARRDLPAALAPEALGRDVLGDAVHGPLACVVELEDQAHHHRPVGVEDEPAASVLALVEVADGCGGRPVAIGGLVVHPLADLLREVVDVVLRHEHLDAVDELLGGPGLVGEHHALLHEVDVDLERVDRHPVLEVAVQAVGLLDEHHRLDLPLLAQEGEHLPEGGAAGALGGLDVGVLLHDVEALLVGVGTQQVELGRDGVALAFLLAGRHAGVDDGLAADGCRGGGALAARAAAGAASGVATGGPAGHDASL